MNPVNDWEKHLESIYFKALKNRVYHSLRSAFFNRCRFWVATIIFIIGLLSILLTCSIFSFGIFPEKFLTLAQEAFILSCLAFLLSFFSFALNFTEKHLLHKSLSDNWGELIQKIDDKSSEGEGVEGEIYATFAKERNFIIKNEPLMLPALEAIAYNHVSMKYYKSANLIPIPWWVRLFRNWFSFSGRDFTPKPNKKA